MSAPILLVYVCFAAGILAGGAAHAPGWTLIAACFCAALSMRSSRYSIAIASHVLLLMLLGIHFLQAQQGRYHSAPFREFVLANEQDTFRVSGTVLQTPEISDDYWVVRIRVKSVAGTPMDGVARVTVSGDIAAPPAVDDELEVYARFRLPYNFGAEGSFDYLRYLRKEGVHALGSVKSSRLVRVTRPGTSLRSAFSRLRLSLIRRLRDGYSAPDAAVLRALWLDDRAGLHPDTERALIDAGIFHVIAISGFHVAVVLAIGYLLLKQFVPYRFALALLGMFLLFYFLLLEGRSSITRSFLMFLAVSFASMRNEKIPWGNALGLCALLQIAWNPLELFDAGYHLTYLSTAAILFLAVPICRKVRLPRRIYRYAFDFAVTSLCVQVVLAPYQAWTFHRVPLAALAANWTAVPLSSVLIAMGVVQMPFPFVQDMTAPIVRSVLHMMMRGSLVFSGNWLQTALTPVFPAVLGFYASIVAALLVRRMWKRAFLAATAAALLGSLWIPYDSPDRAFRMHVIDVGQGDAILMEYPDGTYDLVDGGGFWNAEALDIGESVLLPYFSRMGVRRLQNVFLTHAHADHMNGLFTVLRYIPVHSLWVTRRPLASPAYQQMAALWIRDIRCAKAGEVIWRGGVRLTVLAPGDSRPELKVANDDSLVMLVEHRGRRILLTGDAEKDTEYLLSAGDLPDVDVLKVPHHGSRTSSTEAFLESVRPGMALISVGRGNWFGHPHPEVIERYRRFHVTLYRTDRVGTIRVLVKQDGSMSVDAFAWR